VGTLFLLSGLAMGLAMWQFERLWVVVDFLLLKVAISIDRPPEAPAGDQQEMSDYPADRG